MVFPGRRMKSQTTSLAKNCSKIIHGDFEVFWNIVIASEVVRLFILLPGKTTPFEKESSQLLTAVTCKNVIRLICDDPPLVGQ